MAREKKTYWENLVRLDAAFPRRDLIPLKEAATYIGCDYRTLLKAKDFPPQDGTYPSHCANPRDRMIPGIYCFPTGLGPFRLEGRPEIKKRLPPVRQPPLRFLK